MNRKNEKVTIEFEKSQILFPNGYYFKQSPLHKTRKIRSDQISEVNLNTFPPSLVYQNNEVIFLKKEFESTLKEFAEYNKVPVVRRLDIWEHINRPYLDTEFERTEKQQSLKELNENGISESDLKKIRKKVGKTMFLNFLVWEWTYLGLFDYLHWTFLTKKKYWWSMEIALRNYKKTLPNNLYN